MPISSLLAKLLISALTLLSACAAQGQQYPSKPIRVLAGGIGSGNDIIVRMISPGLAAGLGYPVIVDNRGSGLIPAEIVSKAPPDGHTLMASYNTMTIGPLLQEARYDPVRDFAAIVWMTNAPGVLVINLSVAATTVKELIALAKARPGELNYASSATGASNHLAAELFKSMAGVNIVRVPYKDGARQLVDLFGGQVQLSFLNAAQATPHVKSGKLRALGITAAQPSALAPGLPTIAASGLPGYESVSMVGMMAPAKTPTVVIQRLNSEIVQILNKPEIKQKFFDSGVETVGSTPEEYAAKVKAEIVRMGKVIKDAGIKAD